MIVRRSPASTYSCTDSSGMLRSHSALTARCLSRGASARARATSSSALGMLFTGATEDSISTALMQTPWSDAADYRADALIIDRHGQAAHLETRQITHEKGINAQAVELGHVTGEQCLALLRGKIVFGDGCGGIRLHCGPEAVIAQHLAAEIVDRVDRHGSAPAPGGGGGPPLHLRQDKIRPPGARGGGQGGPIGAVHGGSA